VRTAALGLLCISRDENRGEGEREKDKGKHFVDFREHSRVTAGFCFDPFIPGTFIFPY
jgi:hypothetical protein